MDEQFIRTQMLLGAPAMERLQNSHVAVLGLGGVGGWCAEALCRSGVGELTLADQDTVSVSNINRQDAALWSTVGMEKARATALRLSDIAPSCTLHPLAIRYEADRREEFFAAKYDYIVDAIDLVSCKLDLIETAHRRAIPIISALGTGNKRDAQQLRIADISQTEGCPLARVVRKELRKGGVFPGTRPLRRGGERGPASRTAVHPRQRHVGARRGGAAAGPGRYSGACGRTRIRSHAFLTTHAPKSPHREPMAAPASTSLGKWTPTYSRDRPMTTAIHTAATFIHRLGAVMHTARAKAKAALVWPDGKELGSCSGTRLTKFSMTSQGRSRATKGLMVKFTTTSPTSMAHSAEAPALRVGLYSSSSTPSVMNSIPLFPSWVYSFMNGSSRTHRMFSAIHTRACSSNC